ncbi:hypothetical protein [Chryseobacterium sp.]|uniref:hypothetical protein n=1 Tax=Chryseobacterium sp. TaxID=1871047 RepID=UPI0031E3F91F
MKNNAISVKIEHIQTIEKYEHDPRKNFWVVFQDIRLNRNDNNDRSIESYEYLIMNQLGEKLSRLLINYCSRGIIRNMKDESILSKETAYKIAIASQIIFKVTNLKYGSLGFEIITEPIDKFLDIFDSNFDLMRMFFENYVPEAFIETVKENYSPSKYDDLPLSFTYDFSEVLKNYPRTTRITVDNNDRPDKIDRTKWLIGLFTSPMLFPFIIALIILYFTYQKLDTANKIYLEQNNLIQKQKEEVIKGYKDLIEQYKQH